MTQSTDDFSEIPSDEAAHRMMDLAACTFLREAVEKDPDLGDCMLAYFQGRMGPAEAVALLLRNSETRDRLKAAVAAAEATPAG